MTKAKKDAKKGAKPAAPNPAVKAAAPKKPADAPQAGAEKVLTEEEQYQADLLADAEEEKRLAEEKRVRELQGAGEAMRKAEEENEKAIATDAGIVAKEATELAEKAQEVAADAAALAKEATIATSHPDMCDPKIFGSFDLNSDYCRDCAKAFANCATACKALRDSRAATGGMKPQKAAKTGAGVAKPKTGPVSKFSQSYLTMQNGKIDTSLETAKTIAQHALDTGTSDARVKSHIAWLKVNRSAVCKQVVADGKIHFELLTPAPAAPAA